MSIYEKLKKDHEELKPLLQKLVEATELNKDIEKILDQIEDELIPHSRAEEAIFYNTLKEESDASGKRVASSFAEHAKAETLLRTLQGLSKVDSEWTNTAKKLQEDIEHHIAEEESVIFNIAHDVFSEEEAVQLGKAFDKLKPEYREQGAVKNAVDMISNMLPKRFADRIRNSLHQAS